MSVFTERLELLKTKKQILQKDVAASVGLSLRAYQYYERGEREPSLSTLVSLANFFDVSLDYLCGLSDNPERR